MTEAPGDPTGTPGLVSAPMEVRPIDADGLVGAGDDALPKVVDFLKAKEVVNADGRAT
jgi:hypothetical protein